MPRLLRRPAASWSRGAVVLAVAALVCSACESDRVPIVSPTANATVAERCHSLVDALPDTLAGELRRPVDPDDAWGAAWGDPPLVLVCGGDKPVGQDPFGSCAVVGGIGWWAPEDQAGDQAVDATLTTVGTEPLVQLTVPATYRPEGVATALTELGPVLRHHVTNADPCR